MPPFPRVPAMYFILSGRWYLGWAINRHGMMAGRHGGSVFGFRHYGRQGYTCMAAAGRWWLGFSDDIFLLFPSPHCLPFNSIGSGTFSFSGTDEKDSLDPVAFRHGMVPLILPCTFAFGGWLGLDRQTC